MDEGEEEVQEQKWRRRRRRKVGTTNSGRVSDFFLTFNGSHQGAVLLLLLHH